MKSWAWMMVAVLLILLKNPAWASQSSVQYRPFPENETVVRGRIKSLNPGSFGVLTLTRIWGKPVITLSKLEKDNSVTLRDEPIMPGQDLQIDLEEEPAFDAEGNGLVLLKIKDALGPNTLQVGQDVIYLPRERAFFKPTPKLLRVLDNKR